MKKTSLLFLLSIAALATGCGNPASVNSDTSSNDSNTADNGNGSSTSTPTSGSETPSSGEQTPSSTGSEVTPSTGEATPSESGSEIPSASGETTPTGGESTPSTVEPSESTEPTEVVPSTPVVPTEPTEPVEPTEPTEPVVPTETEPVEPTEPVVPTEPTEPVDETPTPSEVIETPTPTEVPQTPTQGMPESSEDGWTIVRGEPEVGKSYRLGLDRKDASQNPTIWWMQDQTQKEAYSSTGKDYYLMSADDVSDGAVVEVISATNGFKLKVGERYLQITKSGNYVNNYLKSNASDASVFAYSNIHDAIGLTVDGSFYGSGVKGDKSFTTIGALNFDDFADAFKVNLYYNPDEVLPTEPTELVPSTPVVPTEPTEPVVPTEPTEPIVPTEPTEPVVPTEPTEPVEETPTPSETGEKNTTHTILVYICGANLESGADEYGNNPNPEDGSQATANIEEMCSVDLPEEVNLILETGGALAWNSKYSINADKIQRWKVEDHNLKNLSTLSKTNMGEQSTLESFIKWGVKKYPADKTSIVFWNHGGANSGVCFDENYDGDGLEAKEIKAAIKNAGFSSTNKLEWVGYDACMMAVQDVAEINSEYAKYQVSSQETEPGGGWDWDGWLNTLANDVNISTPDLLKSMTDTYVKKVGDDYNSYADYCDDYADYMEENDIPYIQEGWYYYYPEDFREMASQYRGFNDATFSVLDLTKMSEYKTAFDSMCSNLGNFSRSTYTSGAQGFQIDSGYKLYDADDVLKNIKKKKSTAGADAVLEALSDLVIYNKVGKDSKGACGLCVDGSRVSSGNTNFTSWNSH